MKEGSGVSDRSVAIDREFMRLRVRCEGHRGRASGGFAARLEVVLCEPPVIGYEILQSFTILTHSLRCLDTSKYALFHAFILGELEKPDLNTRDVRSCQFPYSPAL